VPTISPELLMAKACRSSHPDFAGCIDPAGYAVIVAGECYQVAGAISLRDADR